MEYWFTWDGVPGLPDKEGSGTGAVESEDFRDFPPTRITEVGH